MTKVAAAVIALNHRWLLPIIKQQNLIALSLDNNVAISDQIKMGVDDEAPPLLVTSSDAVDEDVPDLVDSAVADLSLTKVPITVVTGMSRVRNLETPSIACTMRYGQKYQCWPNTD